MDKIKIVYSICVAGLGGVFGFLYGGLNEGLICAVCFIIIDYITGLAYAWSTKTVSSKVSRKGVMKKITELILISVGHILDKCVLGGGDTLMQAVCFLFISTEGISILENAANLGVPIPKKLLSVFVQLKLSSENISTAKDIKDEAKCIEEELSGIKNGNKTVEDVVTDISEDVAKVNE